MFPIAESFLVSWVEASLYDVRARLMPALTATHLETWILTSSRHGLWEDLAPIVAATAV